MEIIQCTFCKKPFASYGGKVCTKCLEQLDNSFIIVRDYLDENPNADMDMVEEETGVSSRIILHLLKEGRLILGTSKAPGGGILFCEVCKNPISTGRMCDRCKDDIATTMQKNLSGSKQSESHRSDMQEYRNFKSAAKINKI